MTNSELFKALCEANGLDVAKVNKIQFSGGGIVGGLRKVQITLETRWIEDGITNSGQKVVSFTLDS